ncbi:MULTISPECIES: hypothetical protein [Serratia]|uniref:hypothetical protein n=1 Tax=Serratia TaxID=613 RepID=UPI0006600960|nr:MULTISPECIES: hypothetical protein [Serratia]QLJ60902.1 hypothetical protein HP475_13670 [Serratia marcescens]
MYALKKQTNQSTQVILLGNQFTIKRYPPTGNGAVGSVTGEDPRCCYEIGAEMNAFVTTVEGKTVEVIHRMTKPD